MHCNALREPCWPYCRDPMPAPLGRRSPSVLRHALRGLGRGRGGRPLSTVAAAAAASRANALPSPVALLAELPLTAAAASTVQQSRQIISRILSGEDDRLFIVVGPCSIHDVAAAEDYASKLSALRTKHADTLEIVMRVYFEKPRTTVGWKGLINDSSLLGSYDITAGLRIGRQLLLRINEHYGLPCGVEVMNVPFKNDEFCITNDGFCISND